MIPSDRNELRPIGVESLDLGLTDRSGEVGIPPLHSVQWSLHCPEAFCFPLPHLCQHH